MWFKVVTFLGLVLGPVFLEAGCPAVSPIPARPIEPDWKASEKYLDIRRTDVIYRDHGCADFPKKVEQSYHCVELWFKNKFSESNPPVSPTQVFTEFKYKTSAESWKPVVTWVEHINPWRARACAAAPGGLEGALNGGKMRWLAFYNLPSSVTEKSGVIPYNSIGAVTTGVKCMHIDFPQPFLSAPIIKLQLKLKYGLMSATDAMTIWAKAVTNTGMEICMEEFYAWSTYHHEFDIHWYGISGAHTQDNYASHKKIAFPETVAYPTNHAELNQFFCQNVTIPRMYPCGAILLQPVIQDMAACGSPVVAWVSYQHGDIATVCYADKRGFSDRRKVSVEVHMIMYGHADPCIGLTCVATQSCLHPTWNTAACGCHSHCGKEENEVCGTNMKTYKNKCLLEKDACDSGKPFSYAHHGECEEYTMDHGREQLQSVSNCEGLYCKVISTRSNVWYPNADVTVQISVNWMNDIDGEMPTTHDATSSWVENVTPNTFRACVMEAGRRTLQNAPYINWFAYQGKLPETKSHKVEAGEWRTGTHCVPIHERKVMQKPMEQHPPVCPTTDLSDGMNVELDKDGKSPEKDQEKWHYDSGVMSKIFGKEQHDWLKRMMTGYGVKKMNLTSGMKIMKATLMMTVEHTGVKTRSAPQDAINVWMEYDAGTEESFICMREMSNWDGLHKDIQVHWTLFNNSMIEDVGFSHKLFFKPMYMAPMYSNYAFCQTKKLLPKEFSLIPGTSATVLVSLEHKIPAHSAFESMKKYKRYQEEVRKGMPMGEYAFNMREEQPSWMMPHMWRSNLSGWRPHMRINKNADYSTWVEGMNDTHIKVCQKSLYSGFHYEGVMVSLFVLPDRCAPGSLYINSGMCGKYNPTCATATIASQVCSQQGGFLGAPENPRDNYWTSYLANQQSIVLAKTDALQEGVWKRGFGNPSTSNYSRWAAGFPKGVLPADDCSVQRGRSEDFTEVDVSCISCQSYVCVSAAPTLSCDFKDDFCMNDGECKMNAPTQYSCDCKVGFTGSRCETKI